MMSLSSPIIGMSSNYSYHSHSIFQQYQQYLKISNFSNSSLALEYFNGASNCENDCRDKVLFLCVELLHDKIKKLNTNIIKPLWNREGIYDSNTMNIISKPTCQYSIEQYTNNPNQIVFVMEQSNCNIRGGSVFDIISTTSSSIEQNSFIDSCDVDDLFNGQYLIFCPSHRSTITRYKHLRLSYTNSSSTNFDKSSYHLCINLSIYLDYEYYDAFAQQGSFFERQWEPMHHFILHREYCTSILSFSIKSKPISHEKFPLYKVSKYSLGNWISSNPFNMSWTWKWLYHSDFDLQTFDFSKCFLSNRKIIMLGESHMRYNWDAIIYEYETKYKNTSSIEYLTRKHQTISKYNISYEFILFFKNFAKRIDNICDDIELDSIKTMRYTIVLQMGAWDISFWNLENILQNPNSLNDFLNMLEFTINRQCISSIDFIWVSNVPYPLCNNMKTLYECKSKRLARNNYAILLLNEIIEYHLVKLLHKYPNIFHLQYIDAYRIILPLLAYEEPVCLNHFVCHLDNENGIEYTSSGKIVVNALIRSICQI